MKNDPIPPQDHISRWCKPSQIDNGIVGSSAFMLGTNDIDDALSVNWLEFFGYADRDREIAEIQHILSLKMIEIKKTSRIAVLNVGQSLDAIEKLLSGKLNVTVLHNPDREEGRWEDPSHASIYGLTRDDDSQTAATALCDSIIDLYPATPS